MNLHEFFIVCPLVFLAGFVDAIAGGGGLISLPAYMFAGVPVHNAIATNKLSSATGTAVSTWHLVKSRCVDLFLVPGTVACAFVGSIAGANLALIISDKVLKTVLVFVHSGCGSSVCYVTKSEAGDPGRIYQKETVSDHGGMFIRDRYL